MKTEEAYSEPNQISELVRFGEIVKPLTIFAKRPILYVWQDSVYVSDARRKHRLLTDVY